MQQNPLAQIEFVAFIGFVIWLFLWQHKSSRPDRSDDEHTQEEQSQLRADPTEAQAGSPDQTASRPPSGDA